MSENIESFSICKTNKNKLDTSSKVISLNFSHEIKSQRIKKEVIRFFQSLGENIKQISSDWLLNILETMQNYTDSCSSDSTLNSSSIILNDTEDSPEANHSKQDLQKPKPKGKKGGILTSFIDIPDRTSKNARRRKEQSKPRKFPKRDYFRQKIARKYRKELKKILRLAEKINSTINTDDFFANEFHEHSIHNQETIEPKILMFAEKPLSKEAYDSFFKSDDIVIVNFKFFIEEFFNSEVSELIHKLGFKCCEREEHLECKNKWIELRDWVFYEFTGKKFREIYINNF